MAEHQVLFCPFCRESFEGLRSCPEHDLALVPFSRLAPDPLEIRAVPSLDEDAPLAAAELRFGRGLVALGALGDALALLVPLVRRPDGVTLSTLLVATALPALWTLGLVSFTLLFVLQRRRSLRALRGLRVLVPALALLPPATLAWELGRLRAGVAPWLTRGANVEVGPAVYVAGFAAVLTVWGGLRLGVRR